MYKLFGLRKNFQSFSSSLIREKYVQPCFRLLCDFSKLNGEEDLNTNASTNNLNPNFVMSEMYLEDNLLITLGENGLIYITDVVGIINGKFNLKAKVIKKFGSNQKSAKSIAWNKKNNTLLIVYLNREGNIPELKCYSIEIDQLKRYLNMNSDEELIEINEENLNFINLFPSENLTSPAFIEFDEINSKIITRNSLGTYKIWQMEDNKLIFELTDKRIEEIRTANGLLVTIRSTNDSDKLLISIYQIDIGKLIINYEINLLSHFGLEILEIFDRTLLFKQTTRPAIVVDLISNKFNNINNQYLDEKSLFIYLPSIKMFLSLSDNNLIFYTTEGKFVKCLSNEKVKTINPNHIHVTPDKNYLIVYWEERKSNKKLIVKDIHKTENFITPNNKNKISKNINDEIFSDNLSLRNSYTSRKRSVNNSNNLNKAFILDSNVSNLFNSNISSISKRSEEEDCSDLRSNIILNQKENCVDFFQGEFEFICLKEDPTFVKLNITADNSNLIYKDDEYFKIENEKISYFTFHQKTMRIYIVMESGKLFECSI